MTHLIGPSIFRLLAGVAILSEFLVVYGQRHTLFGNEGIVSHTDYVSLTGQFSIYWLTPTQFTFEIAYHASIVVAFLWTMGVKTRWLTPCLALCWTSLMDRGPGIWDGGHNLIAILLIYSCFMEVGAHLSVGTTTRRRPAPQSQASGIVHNTAIAAFAVQVCIVYFVAGLLKARGSTWLDGSALYFAMADLEFAWPGVAEALYSNGVVLSILGPLTIFFQISFPFFFFLNRKSRIVILMVGLLFHASIAVFMGLITFATFFIGADLALIQDDEYRRLARWLKRVGVALSSSLKGKRRATEVALQQRP